MHDRAWASLAIACSFALGGCAGNGEGLDESGRPIDAGPPPLEATFDSIQQNVFTPICTQCHAGAQAPLGLRLDAASSYAMLVNAPSVEVPGLRRVRPGDPDASYLIQKIEGTAAIGGRMPLNGPPLPQATIAVIRQWIVEGAQRPAAAGEGVPATLQAIAPNDDAIVAAPPHELLIQATTALDTSRLDANTVVLMRSGRDGSFDEGNEIVVAGARIEIRSLDPTVIAVEMPPEQWVADSYRLVIAGSGAVPAVDLAGRVIDGDGDGTVGGDFVAHFEIGGTL